MSPAGLHLELEVGGVTYDAENAQVSTGSEGNTYRWSRTGSPWAFNTQVSVRLDVPLINICGRSAVADAIVAATPSFDFCHMTSQLDLAGITRLDLSGVDLGGLQPQLPPGTFDGLYSLETLDLSDTHLLSLSSGIFEGLDNLTELDLSDTLLQRGSVPVGVFDGLDNLEVLRIANAGYQDRGIHLLDDDIFKNLVNLRELDVRPSQPHLAAPRSLLPLTSLTTYNGQTYTRPAKPPLNLQYASGRIDHQLANYTSCYTVTLKWDAPTGVTDITGYRVLRNLGSESLSSYAAQTGRTGTSTRFFVDGRDADVCADTSGISVSYFVTAITADGDSFPAKVHVNQTSQTFQASQVPSTPMLRGSLYDEDYKVRLQWDDPGDPTISGYEISYRPSSSAAWRTIVVNTGNVLLYDYDTQPLEDNSRSLEDAFILNAFRDEGPEHTDSREFRIRALNAAGNSGWSNVVRPFQ